MGDKSVQVIAYTIASLFLIGLSRIAPTTAVWLALAVTSGVLLSHNAEFTALAQRVVDAYGNKGSTAAPGGPIPPGVSTNPHTLQE